MSLCSFSAPWFTAAATLSLAVAALASTPALAGGGWEKVEDDDGLTIYNRSKAGSDVKEVKAVGFINAPHWVCKNVVDDEGNYKNFMPYTEVSTIIKDVPEKDYKISYQRISAPLVDDRDYTIRILNESFKKPDGSIVYKKRWTEANKLGPPKRDGVVRVATNEGSWTFEAVSATKTKATYYLYTNPGGSLPGWVVNQANGSAIPGVFEAIIGQTKKAKYKKGTPALKGARAKKAAPPATMKAVPAATPQTVPAAKVAPTKAPSAPAPKG